MRRNRPVRMLLMIHILTLLLAGCAQPERTALTPVPQQTPTSAGVVEPATVITFACFSQLLDDYERLAQEFHSTHPDLAIHVITVEDVLGSDATTFQEALPLLASQADAFAYPLPQPGAEQGQVLDLTPFLETDPTFEAEDFFPGVLQAYRWQGGTWALPGNLDLSLIAYDQERFDAAGVPYPSIGWSYDEFVATARQLTHHREGEVEYGFLDPGSEGVLSFVRGRAGVLVNREVWPWQPLLDRPEVVEAVQWYADLVLKYEVMPNAGQMEESLLADLYRNRTAMWVDTLTGVEGGEREELVGVVPFPAGPYPAHALTTWGYFVSAGTAHPQTAWRWLVFLTRQGGIGGGIPPRRSVAEASGFWEKVSEGRAAVYRHALENAFFPPGWEVEEALHEALRAVLRGEKEAAEALTEAQESLSNLLAEPEAPSTPVAATRPIPKPSPVQARSITFVPEIFPSPAIREKYGKLADLFQETHPHIHIRLGSISPPSTPFSPIRLMAQESDCFSWNMLPGGTERQYILNVQPLLEADTAFPLDDFFPQVLDTARWEGDLWALPYAIAPPVIHYNKDLFDAAGVAYPQPDWTWDDFVATAVALTDGQGASKQYGFGVMQFELVRQFVQQQAGLLWDVTVVPPRPRLDDPAVVEATRRLADLVRVYKVMEPISPPNAETWFDQLWRWEAMKNAGRIAMWLDYSVPTVLNEADLPEFQTGMAPLPQGEGSLESRVYFFYISAEAEHPEDCWAWLEFLTGQALKPGAFPARRSLVESDLFREQVTEEEAEALLFSVEHSDSVNLQIGSMYPELVRVYDWFDRAYVEIVEGGDAEQVLGEAQRKAESFVFCLQQQGRFDDQEAALACARQADPEY